MSYINRNYLLVIFTTKIKENVVAKNGQQKDAVSFGILWYPKLLWR